MNLFTRVLPKARHSCHCWSTSSEGNFQALMVHCLESVEPHTIRRVTSVPVLKKREQAHDIYVADYR